MLGRTLTLLAVMAWLAGVAGPAWAADTNPDWLKKPTAESLMGLFPREAMRQGRDGGAIIECIITVQGTLRACKVLSETPPGLGFGGAAIALTPQFLMRPATHDGVPYETTVRIPLNWKRMAGMEPPSASDKSGLVYSNLPMLEAPNMAQVAAAMPKKARDAKVSGIASLNCRIIKGGRLNQCDTVREEPKGYGFASAARSLATTSFAVTNVKPDGESLVGSRSMLVIAFDANAVEHPVIGRPKWQVVPRVKDIEAVTPDKAKAAKIYKARVQMSCEVVAGGKVGDCRVTSEDPGGLGWGDAAINLAPFFQLSIWTEEGLPTVGGRVNIPLRFDLTVPPAEPPKPAAP